MRVLTTPRFQFPSSFEQLPAELFQNFFQIDWKQTEEMYREAFEQARAVLRPAVTDRLAPFWN
jgi:hypothetical protein